MKDVDEYVPAYQDSSAPEEMFAGICRSVGYEVVECTAAEMSFAFQNANHVKSRFILHWNCFRYQATVLLLQYLGVRDLDDEVIVFHF